MKRIPHIWSIVINILLLTTILFSCGGKDPKGQPEELPENTNFTGEYEKKVLLEQFTSEFCTACPIVERYLDNLVETRIPKGKVIRIAYHNCFKEDPYTIKAFEAYEWFWNKENTYNPAVMIDRTVFLNENKPIINITKCMDTEHPKRGFIPLYLKPSLEKKSPVRFTTINTDRNENTNEITLSINGEIDRRYKKSLSTLRISVYLVGDNLPVKNTAPVDPLTEHNNVVLLPFTEIFGDPLTIKEGKFSLNYKKIPNKIFETEDLRIVFFVHHYDEKDLSKNEVLQAEEKII